MMRPRQTMCSPQKQIQAFSIGSGFLRLFLAMTLGVIQEPPHVGCYLLNQLSQLDPDLGNFSRVNLAVSEEISGFFQIGACRADLASSRALRN